MNVIIINRAVLTEPLLGLVSWRFQISEADYLNIQNNFELLEVETATGVVFAKDFYLPFTPDSYNSLWLVFIEGGLWYLSFLVTPDTPAFVGNTIADLSFSIPEVDNNFLTFPYVEDEVSFTLDQKYFNFKTDNVGTYFQFDATIIIKSFFSNAEKTISLPQKVMVFNGKASVNLGMIIHRLMDQFATPNNLYYQYVPARLSVECIEKEFIDNSVVRSVSYTNLFFLAGLSRGFTEYGFLNFNAKPTRVTKNGYYILNIYAKDVAYYLKVYKNNVLQTSELLANLLEKSVVSKRITFGDYAQGDVVTYKYVSEVDDTIVSEKTFCMFPETQTSNVITWEDEFLLQSTLECTGDFSIFSEFEFKTQKTYQNLVEQLKVLETTKEVMLTINTGWLMFSDIDTVESLMRSKRVWLNDINLVPIGKKMTNQNITDETIDFSLEFKINRKYNEETFSL